MKLLIMLLFSYTASATNYFVKNAGSDGANGLSIGNAWATVPKVNGFSFTSGDSVFFNRGDVWNERLNIQSNVYYGAYGTGSKPHITGLYTAIGLTDSSHIWSVAIPNSVDDQNLVLINGVPYKKGRYPNSTFLTAGPNTYYKLTPQQVSPISFVGAEAVTGGQAWIWDKNPIAFQDPDSIILGTPMTYNMGGAGCNWFVQNALYTLDLNTEWYYRSSPKKLYIRYDSVLAPTVQYSILDTVVSGHNVNNTTVENFKFSGGNKATVSLDTNHTVSIKNCDIINSGANGVHLNKSISTLLYGDSINYSWNDGIYMRWPSDSSWIDSSVIRNSGTQQGMNVSGNAAKEGVFAYGNVIKFTRNRIINSGYNAYTFFGSKDTTYRNFIDSFCITAADGGAIYSDGSAVAQTGSLIRSNIVTHGLGFNGHAVAGIYMDNSSTGIRIDSNTVSGVFGIVFFATVSGAGIVLNGGSNFTVKYNTVLNDTGTCYWTGNAAALSNVTTTNNKFYSKIRTIPVVYSGVLNGTVTEDSNYVLRSNASDSLFHDGANGWYGLASWQAAKSKDLNSSATFPSGIESPASGTLYYNNTFSQTITNINGRYVDEAGNVYNNSITLQPFTSKILWRTTSQTPHNIGNLIFD